MDFTDLFIKHGAASYDKQIYLRAMYGKTGWGFDLNTGVLRANCFFRAPYPRGALYLFIKDPKYKRSVTRPVRRIVRAFPLFLSQHFVADQRAAFMNYLQFYRLNVTEEGNCVKAAGVVPRSIHGEGTQEQLVAEFDDANRLISLQMA